MEAKLTDIDAHTRELSLTLDGLETTRRVGLALGRALPAEAIVLFSGGLGAGKTTLVKSVCEGLGIDPRQVISPTYTLVNVYPGPRSVYHVDLFRLERPEALLELDRDDWVNPEGPTLVEWPEHARPLLEGDPVLEARLLLDERDEQRRHLTLTGAEAVYGQVFAALAGDPVVEGPHIE